MIMRPAGGAEGVPIIGSHDLLAARIRRLEPGARLEFQGLGRSLWPVVKSGTRMILERTGERLPVRSGEIVLAWLPNKGSLVCHVVSSTDPVTTASVLGLPDGEVEVLGRVVGVKGRGRVRFGLLGTRLTLRVLRLAGRLASRKGLGPRLRAEVDALFQRRPVAVLRRRFFGPFEIRRLARNDLEKLVIFTGHHLPSLSAEWLEAQLCGAWEQEEGGAFAAFDRRNEIRAFAFLGRYTNEGVDVPGVWLRSLYTEPFARRLGLNGRILKALLLLSRAQGVQEVFSDVRRDNVRSLALHLKHVFVEVPSDELAPFEPLIRRSERRGHELAILRWRATEPLAPT